MRRDTSRDGATPEDKLLIAKLDREEWKQTLRHRVVAAQKSARNRTDRPPVHLRKPKPPRKVRSLTDVVLKALARADPKTATKAIQLRRAALKEPT